MYHIARMKVAEALSDIDQLVAAVSVGSTRQAEHRPVLFGLHRHVSRGIAGVLHRASNAK